MESMDDTDRTHGHRGPVAYDFAPKRSSRSRSLTTASQQTPLNTPEMDFECERREVQPLPGEDSAAPTRNKRPSWMNTPVDCWCKCGKCHPMPYEVEHICCQELHSPKKKRIRKTVLYYTWRWIWENLSYPCSVGGRCCENMLHERTRNGRRNSCAPVTSPHRRLAPHLHKFFWEIWTLKWQNKHYFTKLWRKTFDYG